MVAMGKVSRAIGVKKPIFTGCISVRDDDTEPDSLVETVVCGSSGLWVSFSADFKLDGIDNFRLNL